MIHRAWYSTEQHLNKMEELRRSTPFMRRLIQMYDGVDTFPHALQKGSKILSPTVSVVRFEINERYLKMRSLDNQSEGMLSAKAVNYRKDIDMEVAYNSQLVVTQIDWNPKVFGWSKRTWIKVTPLDVAPFLISVSELPKQADKRKTNLVFSKITKGITNCSS